MAMSTQRLFTFVIMLNLMMFLLGGYMYGADSEGRELGNYIGSLDAVTEAGNASLTANPDEETLQIDPNILDARGGIGFFRNLIKSVVVPDKDECGYGLCGGRTGLRLYQFALLFVFILDIFAIYEFFQITWGKKTS